MALQSSYINHNITQNKEITKAGRVEMLVRETRNENQSDELEKYMK